MSEAMAELIGLALDLGAIRLSPSQPFTWASGFRMPVYCDNRALLASARARRLVAEGFAARLKESVFQPDLVAGTATAGIPHATTLADLLGLPMVYVRDKPKEHGAGRQIEGLGTGATLKGRKVLLVEDLISTGGSSIKAIQALRTEGSDCSLCLSIMSYGFPEARRAFEDLRPICRTESLLTFDRIEPVAIQRRVFKEDQVASLRAWQADPFGWGAKNGFPRVEK
jgi:orotate phosphoribosyltransferase